MTYQPHEVKSPSLRIECINLFNIYINLFPTYQPHEVKSPSLRPAPAKSKLNTEYLKRLKGFTLTLKYKCNTV